MALTQASEEGLKISNAGTNGQYLQKQSGNTGGLTWADVPAGVGGATGADFNDDVKIRLGTGNDLQIFHNGSTSIIDSTTVNLDIQSSGAINIKPADAAGITAFNGGAVELYHNAVKTFETHANGITVKGPEGGEAIINLQCDEGDDNADKWRIAAFDGADMYFSNYTDGGWEHNIIIKGGGSTELYHNDSKRFETTSAGWKSIDSIKGVWGTGDDLEIYHSSNNSSYISHANASGDLIISSEREIAIKHGSEQMIRCTNDGKVGLYYDGSEKLETLSGGAKVTGTLEVTSYISQDDSVWHYWGTGDDCGIMHDGSNMTMRNGTGKIRLEPKSGELGIEIEPDESVKLYYNNEKKLETVATGIRITSATNGGAELFKCTNSDDGNYGGLMIKGGINDRECRFQSTSGSSYFTFRTEDSGGGVSEHFRIAYNGDLTATDTSIGSNSDSRLKKNISNYTYDLAKFKQFSTKTFDWINPGAHGNKSGRRGFLAQDLESIDNYWIYDQVLPNDSVDLSLLDADGIAKTSKLGEKDAMYVSVIQQLITKIETLETKVAALEAG